VTEPTLSDEAREQVAAAIYAVRKVIHWKPGKDIEHLETRRKHGHLAPDATLADYQAIISAVLHSESAELYVFAWMEG
jgi:hypothetical protein